MVPVRTFLQDFQDQVEFRRRLDHHLHRVTVDLHPLGSS